MNTQYKPGGNERLGKLGIMVVRIIVHRGSEREEAMLGMPCWDSTSVARAYCETLSIYITPVWSRSVSSLPALFGGECRDSNSDVCLAGSGGDIGACGQKLNRTTPRVPTSPTVL